MERRRVLVAGLAFYLAVIAVGVFGPAPMELVRDTARLVGNLIPGSRSSAGNVLGPLSAEELGNIVVFVPLGVLVPVLWPRRWRWALPIGFAVSVGIEAVQWALLDWRSPQLRDVVWNTTGAAAGVVGWLMFRAGSRRWRPTAGQRQTGRVEQTRS